MEDNFSLNELLMISSIFVLHNEGIVKKERNIKKEYSGTGSESEKMRVPKELSHKRLES